MLSSIQIIRYMRVMDAMMPPCEYIKKGEKRKEVCHTCQGLRTAQMSSFPSSPNPAISTECREPGPRPNEMSDDA